MYSLPCALYLFPIFLKTKPIPFLLVSLFPIKPINLVGIKIEYIIQIYFLYCDVVNKLII
jgi:hypothetical protein